MGRRQWLGDWRRRLSQPRLPQLEISARRQRRHRRPRQHHLRPRQCHLRLQSQRTGRNTKLRIVGTARRSVIHSRRMLLLPAGALCVYVGDRRSSRQLLPDSRQHGGRRIRAAKLQLVSSLQRMHQRRRMPGKLGPSLFNVAGTRGLGQRRPYFPDRLLHLRRLRQLPVSIQMGDCRMGGPFQGL